MFEILEKRSLAEGICLMRIHAPRIAKSALPGQFVSVRSDEFGERVPLTISDYDAEAGSVTIVTQTIGVSTRKICALEVGQCFADFAGPLGHPSEFVHEPLDELRKKRFLFVAGGVGTAPVYPQVKWLHAHGVKADVVIGAKTRSMLIYTDAMRAVADTLYIATDDGSEGFHGMVKLNGTGKRIWQGLTEGRTDDDIARDLAQEYGVSPERAAADVREFVGQVREAGFLAS